VADRLAGRSVGQTFFVGTKEEVGAVVRACPEEIAFRLSYIDAEELTALAALM